MNFHHIAMIALRVLLLGGLFIAYSSAAIGLIGLGDVRTVAKFILIGAIVAFVALLLYFVVSDLELRRRLRRHLAAR